MLGAEVAAYLVTAGYGTLNTNVFYNFVPPDPDIMMSVVEYGGEGDEPNLGISGSTTRIEFPRFQLIVRGIRDDSDGPQLRCNNARASLVAVLNQSLSGVRYIGIDCLMPPAPMKVDDDFRVYWISNFRVMKVPSTS